MKGVLVSLLLLLLRLGIGAMFVFSGWMKVRPMGDDASPLAQAPVDEFVKAIHAFKVIPDESAFLVPVLAYAIPFAELLFGVLLIIGRWTRPAGTWLAVMLLGFTILVGSAELRKLDVECGCFGKYKLVCSSKDKACKFFENTALFLLTCPIAIFGAGAFSLDRVMDGNRVKPHKHPAYTKAT